MYDLLLLLHSWLRWVDCGFNMDILENYKGWKSGLSYSASVKNGIRFYSFTTHALVIGLILYYFVSPDDAKYSE